MGLRSRWSAWATSKRMRHAQPWRRWGYSSFHVAFWAAFAAVAILSGAKVVPTPETHVSTWSIGQLAVDPLRRHSAWAIPVLSVVLALVSVLKSYVGQPKLWRTVHQLLEVTRGRLFKDDIAQGALDYDHRLTLFKKVRFRFCHRPFSGWLIPVARSGVSTMRSPSAFLAPDDPDQRTGVAGQSFYQEDVIVTRDGLPDLAGDVTELDLQEYALKTWVTVDSIRQRKPRARSFAATRVVVKRKPWGVLVVDSVNPAGKPTEEVALLAKLLGTVLENHGG